MLSFQHVDDVPSPKSQKNVLLADEPKIPSIFKKRMTSDFQGLKLEPIRRFSNISSDLYTDGSSNSSKVYDGFSALFRVEKTPLGIGSSASVYACQLNEDRIDKLIVNKDGQIIASTLTQNLSLCVKISTYHENSQPLLNEFQILSQLDSPRIIKASAFFDDWESNKCYFVMERGIGCTLE